MPVLSNERWERFCEGIVEGKKDYEAYIAAGYTAKYASARAGASGLLTNPDIQARIAEMRQKRAQKAEITLDDLIGMAAYIYKTAAKAGQYSASVSALKELGVLTGQRIERREQGKPGSFEHMSDDELRRFIESDADKEGGGEAGAIDPRLQAPLRGQPN